MAMMTGTGVDNKTGKRVTIKVADLYRIENDKIVDIRMWWMDLDGMITVQPSHRHF